MMAIRSLNSVAMAQSYEMALSDRRGMHSVRRSPAADGNGRQAASSLRYIAAAEIPPDNHAVVAANLQSFCNVRSWSGFGVPGNNSGHAVSATSPT